MLGNRIHQSSMEAGAHWILNDVLGKPLYAWDSRNHRSRFAYDVLRRPALAQLQEGSASEQLVGRSVYGEALAVAESHNLRGKLFQLFDQGGVATSTDYDFKGNLVRGQRQLAHEYSTTLVWSLAVPLDPPVYSSRIRYDALNRPIQLVAPHSDQPGATINIIQPKYNEANLLEQVHAWLNKNAEPPGLLAAATADLNAVTDIDYDAKGQRMRIGYPGEHERLPSSQVPSLIWCGPPCPHRDSARVALLVESAQASSRYAGYRLKSIPNSCTIIGPT